jgi:hypothetical protein
VDGTGSESCPKAGFGISGVEKFCYHSVSKFDLSEIGCEVGMWVVMAQDCIQWQALVLAVLNLGVLLPVSSFSYRSFSLETPFS